MTIPDQSPLHVAGSPFVMAAGEDFPITIDVAALLAAGETVDGAAITMTLARESGGSAPALPSTRTVASASVAQPTLTGTVIGQRVNGLVAGNRYVLTATFGVTSSTKDRQAALTIICPAPTAWQRSALHGEPPSFWIGAGEDLTIGLDAATRLESGQAIDSGDIVVTLTDEAGAAVSGLAAPTLDGTEIRQRVSGLTAGVGYLLAATFGVQNGSDQKTVVASILCAKTS